MSFGVPSFVGLVAYSFLIGGDGMVRNYSVLCDNILASPCFRGLENKAKKIKILVSDLKLGTQYNYLVTLKKYVEFARKKGVDPLRFDLVTVKEFLGEYKPTTRQGYAFRLRKIFELNGEIAEFKVQHADNELPEVLTENEVNQIVEATETMKWRALFRLTYEGAMREHEVLNLKIKHVRFDKFGAEVFVPSTKSQPLWLRIIDSVPLLQAWIEQHPQRGDREAYVFLGRKEGEPLTYIAFYLALKRTAKKVGVEKRVFPHLLRHSRLAWLKKFGAELGISDSVICKLYGRWSRRNAHHMLDRYGRIEPSEANEIVLKAYGKLGEHKITEQLTKPRECPRCRRENDALSKYCRICGLVLDEKEASDLMERQRERDKRIEELEAEQETFNNLLTVLQDPEKMEKLKEILK